jgi:urease accessory protein
MVFFTSTLPENALLICHRDGGPTIFAEVKHGKGVDDIVGLLLSAWKSSGAYDTSQQRWKEEGRKGSGEV